MEEVWSSQIVIPPSLPSILKKYAKAAIRTQPYDLLVWSAAYFRAMAAGNPPPVKPRLELTLSDCRCLTVGYLKLLIGQFGREGDVSQEELTEKWKDVSLPEDTLQSVLSIGSFSDTVDWPKFVSVSLAFLEESLKGTMLRVCEVLTEEPEGGSAAIPCQLFIDLYRFLGELDCGDEPNVAEETEQDSPPDEGEAEDDSNDIVPADSQTGEDNEGIASPVDAEIEVLLSEKQAEPSEPEAEEQAEPSEPEAEEQAEPDVEENEGEGLEEAGAKKKVILAGIGPRLPAEMMDKVEEYITNCAERQGGMVMPRNLRHFLCPPLDIQSSQPQA